MHCISNPFHCFVVRLRYVLITAMLTLSAFEGMGQISFEHVFECEEPNERIANAFEWAKYHTYAPFEMDSVNVFFRLNRFLDEAEHRNDQNLILVAEYSIAYYHFDALNGGKPWLDELEKVTEKAGKTDRMLWAYMLHKSGWLYYFVQHEYAKGLGLMLQAHDCFTELGYTRNPRASNLLFELAFVFYQLGNYEKIIELLTPAQSYNDTTFLQPHLSMLNTQLQSHLQVLNTLGLAYRELNRPDSSLVYFNRTLKAARDYNDSAWIGIAAINISKYYLGKGDYDKAFPYAEIRYMNSKVKDDRLTRQDSCEALIVLARIDIHQGRTDQALDKLSNAEKSLKGSDDHLTSFDLAHQLYIGKGDAYKQKGEYNNSYISYQKAYRYKDSIELIRKEAQSQTVHTHVVAQQYLSKRKQLEDKNQISLQARNFSLLALLLTGIWILILYNRQRLESRKARQLFESREQLLYTEKLHAEEQLGDYIDLLQEKNKKLVEIGAELEKLKELPRTVTNNYAVESIEKLKKTIIITDEDWFRFRDLFENVHQGFFARLKKLFPDITQGEMRLMALTKLNISVDNMADMLGVSPETVRKTAYRFRKKMPSDMNKNLGKIADSI